MILISLFISTEKKLRRHVKISNYPIQSDPFDGALGPIPNFANALHMPDEDFIEESISQNQTHGKSDLTI
ncbi:MAG TPA: hypothetical protein VH796_00230 [Nitrososphaeraceae archaeon]|jgi:hypothetical protein